MRPLSDHIQIPTHVDFDTCLYLPRWFVDLIESQYLLEVGCFEDHWRNRNIPRLVPFFNIQELTVLPFLIALIQKQILENTVNDEIVISYLNLRKEFPSDLAKSKKTILRIFYSIGSLKLITDTNQGQLKGCSFFAGERWDLSSENPKIYLKIGAETREAFLGYKDAYRPICNKISEFDKRLSEVYDRDILRTISQNDEKNCLIVHKSLWYELKGIEQLLLLRLLKRAQWEESYLSLDGVVSENWLKLTGGLRETLSKNLRESPVGMIKALVKFSKKIKLHAGFSSCWPQNNFEFGETPELSAHAVWRNDQFQLDSIRKYGWQEGIFVHEQLNPTLKLLKPYFHWALGGGRRREELDHYLALRKGGVLGSDSIQSHSAFVVVYGQIISFEDIYWQWVFRKQVKIGSFKLKQSPKLGACYQYLIPIGESAERHRDQMAQFMVALSQHSFELELLLKEESGICLICDYNCNRMNVNDLKTLLQLVGPEIESSSSNLDFRHKDTISVKGVQQTIKIGEDAVQRVSSDLGNSPQNSEGQEADALWSRWNSEQKKNWAKLEFMKVKRSSKEELINLTNNYLDSLDKGSQKMILEIKNKMRPNLFEQHLQKRIEEYLISKRESGSLFEKGTTIN